MQSLAVLSLVALGLSCFKPEASGQTVLTLALDEDFSSFNLTRWKHQVTLSGGGNYEFQYYVNDRNNSYVSGGSLVINPTLLADDIGENGVKTGSITIPPDVCTSSFHFGCQRDASQSGNYLNPIKSARVETSESFTFNYGKVEVRAKLPTGDWLWPAIWLLPASNEYGAWPLSGEIDIMEARGNPPSYAPGGYDRFGTTLHWGASAQTNRFFRTHAIYNRPDLNLTADFHVYGLVWNESYIGTYLDDEDNVVFSHKITQSFWDFGDFTNVANPWSAGGQDAPFDQEFFLIINLAVGGTNGYFPDGFGKPWNNTASNTVNQFYDAKETWLSTWTQPFLIDSVRVWTFQNSTRSSGGVSPVGSHRELIAIAAFMIGIIILLLQ